MAKMDDGWQALAREGKMFITSTGGDERGTGDTIYLYAPDGTRFQFTWARQYGGLKVLVDSTSFEQHLCNHVEVIPESANAVVLVGK